MSDAIPSHTVRRSSHHTTRRRQQDPASPGRLSPQQPARPQGWAGKTPQEILARYQPGKAPPLTVLEVLIKLFNTQHTALEKTVSQKTRQERAQFLRRFFGDLKVIKPLIILNKKIGILFERFKQNYYSCKNKKTKNEKH